MSISAPDASSHCSAAQAACLTLCLAANSLPTSPGERLPLTHCEVLPGNWKGGTMADVHYPAPLVSFPALGASWSTARSLSSRISMTQGEASTKEGTAVQPRWSATSAEELTPSWRLVGTSGTAHRVRTLPLPLSLHRLGKGMRLQQWNLGDFPLSLQTMILLPLFICRAGNPLLCLCLKQTPSTTISEMLAQAYCLVLLQAAQQDKEWKFRKR